MKEEDDKWAAKASDTLSDKDSMSAVTELEHNDLSFTELQKSTKLDKNTLYHKIKKLIKSGIVVNYYQKREDASEYSFYQITSFGREILKKHGDKK